MPYIKDPNTEAAELLSELCVESLPATGDTESRFIPCALESGYYLPFVRVMFLHENRTNDGQQHAPPNGRVEVGQHGVRQIIIFKNSGGKNQDTVNEENNPDEKPNWKHMMLLRMVN